MADIPKPNIVLMLRDFTKTELISFRSNDITLYPKDMYEHKKMREYQDKFNTYGVVSLCKKPSRPHVELSKLKHSVDEPTNRSDVAACEGG